MSRLIDSLLHARRRTAEMKHPSSHATVVLRTLSGARPASRTHRPVVVIALVGMILAVVAAALFWPFGPSTATSSAAPPLVRPAVNTPPASQAPVVPPPSPAVNTAAVQQPPSPAVSTASKAPVTQTTPQAKPATPEARPAVVKAAAAVPPPPAAPAKDAIKTQPKAAATVEPKATVEQKAPRNPSPASKPAAKGAARVEAPPIAAPPPPSAAPAADKRPSGITREGAATDDPFRMALYYHQAGDFPNALVQYKLFLEKNEMSVEGHNNLGLLYQSKGLHDDANREFRRAIAIDPRNIKAHNNLGVGLLQAGDIDAAIQEFKWIMTADSKNVDAMVNLALAQRAANHADDAQETLLRAVQVNQRHAAAHYNLALIYEDGKELAKALEHYEYYLRYASADQAKRMSDVRARCAVLREQMVQR